MRRAQPARRRGRRNGTDDILADPFGERRVRPAARWFQLLGARVQFESNSPRLLDLVDAAYAGLPRHPLTGTPTPLRVSLWLTDRAGTRSRTEPNPLLLGAGQSFLAGATERSNLVVVSPGKRSALVVVSPRMLQYPYHVRYELIEFAAAIRSLTHSTT